jgi:hypothetical protein
VSAVVDLVVVYQTQNAISQSWRCQQKPRRHKRG